MQYQQALNLALKYNRLVSKMLVYGCGFSNAPIRVLLDSLDELHRLELTAT